MTEYISKTQLMKDRKWTESMFRWFKVLPDSHEELTGKNKNLLNYHTKDIAKSNLYLLAKILEIEETPEFKEKMRQSLKSRKTKEAKRAVNDILGIKNITRHSPKDENGNYIR